MRREDQYRIIAAVQSRVMRGVLEPTLTPRQPLDEVLAETVFQQRLRLKEQPRSRRNRVESARWDTIERRLGRVGDAELRGLLAGVVAGYAREVCGNFDERLYALARRLIPPALSVLLNASSPKRLLSDGPQLEPIEEAIIVQGDTEHVRRLHEVGTIIMAPTHVSNLDSMVLAVALARLGMPPFIYGAARDLLTNALLRFFLHNLGAYTVDRHNRDPLYKATLRAYTTLTLEYGYDNLFFPGGTRSRSGALERTLKLGLMNTAIPAYVANLTRGAPRPKIFIVPATLSYQLVLEAETLVDDFLKDVGKSRYIITDDEFSRPHRVMEFVSQLFALDSKIYLTLSRGLDPFGNPVDDNGESLDPHGRVIDPSRYVMVDGTPTVLPQRDREYTRDVGDALLAAYSRDNVIQATHITARAIFTRLRQLNAPSDLIRLIRVAGRQDSLDLRDVYAAARGLLRSVRSLSEQGRLRLVPMLLTASAEDVVADGLRHFAIYHRLPAAERHGDRVLPRDRGLLFFYQNRLEGYGLEEAQNLPPTVTPDNRLWTAS